MSITAPLRFRPSIVPMVTMCMIHAIPIMRSIFEIIAKSEISTEPKEIVESIFVYLSFSFGGPKHHSLVPAALLIAMKNRGIKRKNGNTITTKDVLKGIRRGSKTPGGFCGHAGNCGACVGAGIATAIYHGSTPING